VHLFAHVQRPYQRVSYAPSHPFLLLEHAPGLDGPGFLGGVHLPDQVHQQEDVSVGHLQRQDIDLGNADGAQRLEEDLLGSGEEEKDHGGNASGHAHGEDDGSVDALAGDEDLFRQSKRPQMGAGPEVRYGKEGIAGDEDIEDHGQSYNAREDGDEEPDALDEKPDGNLAQIRKEQRQEVDEDQHPQVADQACGEDHGENGYQFGSRVETLQQAALPGVGLRDESLLQEAEDSIDRFPHEAFLAVVGGRAPARIRVHFLHPVWYH